MSATAIMPSAHLATPETYLDDQRSSGFAQPLEAGVHFYPGVSKPALNEFALHGAWRVTSEFATPTAPGASIQAGFQAAHVYLVLTSEGSVPRSVRVLLDGHPLRSLTVRQQQLYSLVSLSQAEFHDLTVQLPPGVRAYDFTFG
jgi:hypothetical protein